MRSLWLDAKLCMQGAQKCTDCRRQQSFFDFEVSYYLIRDIFIVNLYSCEFVFYWSTM